MATRFTDHLLTGDHSSRPAFGDVPQGTLYACSDHDLIYQSDGSSAWSTWATLGGGGGDITSDAAWAAAGDLIVADGNDSAAILSAGSEGEVLTIASGVPSWASPAGAFDPDDHLPWHIFIPCGPSTPDATTGSPTINFPNDVSLPISSSRQTNNQNGAFAYDVILAAGTWDVHFWVRRSTNTAIVTVQFDGVDKGTSDTYNGSADMSQRSVTGITQATTGKVRVNFKAATKNGSSSSYVMNIFCIELRRTA